MGQVCGQLCGTGGRKGPLLPYEAEVDIAASAADQPNEIQAQGDKSMYCAIALNTGFGDIPGWSDGETCWYPYGGKSVPTKDFKIFEGQILSDAPQGPAAGTQTDGGGQHWYAVTTTKCEHKLRIPGKAKGKSCWYAWDGKEHFTVHFRYVSAASAETADAEPEAEAVVLGAPPAMATPSSALAVAQLRDLVLRSDLTLASLASWATVDFARASLERPDAAEARRLLRGAYLPILWRETCAKVTEGSLPIPQYGGTTVGMQFQCLPLPREGLPSLELKFFFRSIGEKPEGGWPLWIYLHGGGHAVDPRTNDEAWTHWTNWAPPNCVYVAPRAPTDTWNQWHKEHMVDGLSLLIQYFLPFGVDSNRVYLMGYSSGGDGVYRMAPRMADRFAAAAMMAGHPGHAHEIMSSIENLRNVFFTLQVGEHDGGFQRNTECDKYAALLQNFHREDSGGYFHWKGECKGKSHWIEELIHEALPKIAERQRNPVPDVVMWQQSQFCKTQSHCYWLAVEQRLEYGASVRAQREGQKIVLTTSHMRGLKLRLDDRMMDLDQDVIVCHGKRQSAVRAQRTISTMLTTLLETGDPELTFDAELPIA